jgi:DNA excision repair protein ERCC-3
LLIDVHNPGFEGCREAISPFTELEKSPEHIHTYKITPLSLWNAASAGIDAGEVRLRLERWTRFPVPDNVVFFIVDTIERFGKLTLRDSEVSGTLLLTVDDPSIRAELSGQKSLQKYLVPSGDAFLVRLIDRGSVKQALIKIGYPVRDEAPLTEGDPLAISFRETTVSGYPFDVRDYQKEAARALYGDGKAGSGFGTIVLPCGSGKTVVGMEVMRLMKTSTLILTTNVAAVHQWIDELIDKTSLSEEEIGEYTGDRKLIRPVTVGTYQILTWRPDRESDFPHFDIFRKHNWGLVIYDEVHLLPAPVFRVTAEIQALRRAGLTATLVREDGREDDVFSLVGPKRYDVPWRELEQKGWIAEAHCHEIRVPLPQSLKVEYAVADRRGKYRIASENHVKVEITRELIANHKEDHILVIGQYLDQLKEIALAIDAPLNGADRVIVVSKVANFAIDLPDANVAIQVSGTFGSRQEEAQRLGRILRPKERGSTFYSLVSRYTTEEEFAANRQKFLTEQGYKYQIELWEV